MQGRIANRNYQRSFTKMLLVPLASSSAVEELRTRHTDTANAREGTHSKRTNKGDSGNKKLLPTS
jgi:hypothetical protein